MLKKAWPVLLLFFICLAGCSFFASPPGPAADENDNFREAKNESIARDQVGGKSQVQSNTETMEIVLFFADRDGNLVPERRSIPRTPGIARKTMQELCKGPSSSDLLATLPEGTRLRDININIKNGLCTVDFSRELQQKHKGGSSGEILTIYSIVNTLTQFPTVDKVIILVEGMKLPTLAGHMDLSVPLERRPDLLKK